MIPATASAEAPRRTDDNPREPEVVRLTIDEALLVVGDAALPIDDRVASASPDGRQFASIRSHARLTRGLSHGTATSCWHVPRSSWHVPLTQNRSPQPMSAVHATSKHPWLRSNTGVAGVIRAMSQI